MESEVHAVEALREAQRKRQSLQSSSLLDLPSDMRRLGRFAKISLADAGSNATNTDEDVDDSEVMMHCSDVPEMSDGSPEGAEKTCAFVKEHCSPRGGLISYLQLPYCVMNDSPPWVAGFFLLYAQLFPLCSLLSLSYCCLHRVCVCAGCGCFCSSSG